MSKNYNSMDYQNICSRVCTIAAEAANYAAAQLNKVGVAEAETKGLHDYVSRVDKTLEKMLTDALSELIPEAGFIAEEGTRNETGARFNWIVDPLDGTTNFLHGVPVFSISIALQENLETVAGVVYEINRRECFYAWKGGRAMLNGEPINVSGIREPEKALLATGFPYYDFSHIDAYLQVFRELMQHTAGIRRMGSAAVDLAYLACGRFEGFFEYSLHPWDVAAGAFIVQQAGGSVSDFTGGGNYLHGSSIVAGNRAIHAWLLARIRQHFNKPQARQTE